MIRVYGKNYQRLSSPRAWGSLSRASVITASCSWQWGSFCMIYTMSIFNYVIPINYGGYERSFRFYITTMSIRIFWSLYWCCFPQCSHSITLSPFWTVASFCENDMKLIGARNEEAYIQGAHTEQLLSPTPRTLSTIIFIFGKSSYLASEYQDSKAQKINQYSFVCSLHPTPSFPFPSH